MRVVVACCNARGWIHKGVVFSVIQMLRDPRHEVTFVAPTHKPFVHNLHVTVNEFLASDADFLLLVDDDNPPGRNPLDLVELDLDVVGLPTPVWCNMVSGDRPFYLNALHEVRDAQGRVEGFRPLDADPEFVPSGLVECDAVGTGCVLVARRVLADLAARAFSDPAEAPFRRRWNDQGLAFMGNDYAFCQRARAAGWRVWAHFDYTCRHYNELEIREVVEALAAVR